MIRSSSLSLATFALAIVVGCAPRARPLTGVPSVERIPDTAIAGAMRVVFRWRYEEGALHAAGEGIARIVGPDSARLDLFVDGGLGGGTAFLIGDVLEVPGGESLRRFLPPPPLLWAGLGRLAVPAAADTTARLEGTVLRADIGREPVYRATFDVDGLRRLERITDGRIAEWVSRDGGRQDREQVRYVNEGARRSLTIAVTSTERVEGFDADIWDR
ncbi:MAG TPA: hypothetical protein VFY16_06090 [Gemmatimonadaceae bacterium]|jgi:hypothetical protein|nr:hypothetical protein [Gemmatimonadaceae bacterium]